MKSLMKSADDTLVFRSNLKLAADRNPYEPHKIDKSTIVHLRLQHKQFHPICLGNCNALSIYFNQLVSKSKLNSNRLFQHRRRLVAEKLINFCDYSKI